MILEYALIHTTARDPQRANASDAGLDVFYSPQEEKEAICIGPGQSKIIPTGLRFGVPHGYMLEVKNRSSVAAKRSLIVGACVVDSGYDGEIFVNLHNIGTETQYVRAGDKIAQLILNIGKIRIREGYFLKSWPLKRNMEIKGSGSSTLSRTTF